MKIIVVGCGRLGSGLALELSQGGHDVTVIEQDEKRFSKLGHDFKGTTIVGVGFDKKTLEEAGIERADALVTATESDETNALTARIARNFYRVPQVIARLYDPGKAYIYSALGILTISTTEWGIQRAEDLIRYSRVDTVYSAAGSSVEILRVDLPELLVDRTVQDVTRPGEFSVSFIIRGNNGFLPMLGTRLERGDLLYFSCLSTSRKTLEEVLGV